MTYRVLVEWGTQGMKWLDKSGPGEQPPLEFDTVDDAVQAWRKSYANCQDFHIVRVIPWKASEQ